MNTARPETETLLESVSRIVRSRRAAPPPDEAPLLRNGLHIAPFNVVTPWVRVAVPLKARPYAFLTARTPLVQQNLGRNVYVSAIGPSRLASAGTRDTELELLLLRAEIELAPSAKSRTRGILSLELETAWLEPLEQIATFYGTAPLAIVHAFLVKRLDSLRAFDRGEPEAR